MGGREGNGHEVYEPYREAGGKVGACMASAAAGSGATGQERGRFLILQDNLESLDFNLSVEPVEALDEASSIEPAQRNKTMTRALAYGGTRDSVIA